MSWLDWIVVVFGCVMIVSVIIAVILLLTGVLI